MTCAPSKPRAETSGPGSPSRFSCTGCPRRSPGWWSGCSGSTRWSSPAGSGKTAPSSVAWCSASWVSSAWLRTSRLMPTMAGAPGGASAWPARSWRSSCRRTRNSLSPGTPPASLRPVAGLSPALRDDVMTRTLLVVPTTAGVGLARTCLGVVRALDRRGVNVAFVKPVAQPRPDGGPDRSIALAVATTALRPPDPLSAADLEQQLGSGGLDAVLEKIVAAWQPVNDRSDVVVVEGLSPGPANQPGSG